MGPNEVDTLTDWSVSRSWGGRARVRLTNKGDKFVSVIIDLTPVATARVPPAY